MIRRILNPLIAWLYDPAKEGRRMQAAESSLLAGIIKPARYRCDACGVSHDKPDTLVADYPSGSVCRDQDACWQRRRNVEAMKQSAGHMIPEDDR